MTTTLRHDLRKRIADKHRQCILDAFALYDMAGLSPANAAQDISATLFHITAAVLAAATEPDMDEFCRLMKQEIARLKAVQTEEKEGAE